MLWYVIGYLASIILAWSFWVMMTYFFLKSRYGLEKALEITNKILTMIAQENKMVEWIRFIIWPYGLVSRGRVVLRAILEEKGDGP